MAEEKPNNNPPEEIESIKWFKENYPSEYYLVNQIVTHVNQVLAGLGSPGQAIPIDMQAMPTPEGRLFLGMRDVMVIFLGAMSKSLIDVISKNIQAELGPKLLEQLEEKAHNAVKEYAKTVLPGVIEDFKRCKFCLVDNEGNSNYCKHCGSKL
jgi:hypothetical protein